MRIQCGRDIVGINQLTNAELDYQYSQGFLERWLEIITPAPPKQIKEHLDVLVGGIKAYREKYISIQEDYNKLNELYIKLAGLSAQYLETMKQQREQIDQELMEQQREFHHKETTPRNRPRPFIET